MVRVVSWSAGPPQCGPLAVPRSAAVLLHEATATERATLTLSAFSLRSSRLQSAPEAPDATFAAASATCGGVLAVPADSLHSLRSISGLPDALLLQPECVRLDSSANLQRAVPFFLLLRRRTPHTDAWLCSTAATLDVPCLPCSADLQSPKQVKLPGV